MKNFIQLILVFAIIVTGFLFYKNYFEPKQKQLGENELSSKAKNDISTKATSDTTNVKTNNNLIKNLKYNVEFIDSGQYEINASLSELNYDGGIETIFMSDVNAIIIDKNDSKIIIDSDEAIFNNSTYDTNFKKNIKIRYFGNIITSEKLDFYFKKNIIIISKNIIYKGSNTLIKADNIKINLITKKIELFMDNKENKIELTSKK